MDARTQPSGSWSPLRSASRFWEARRLPYNIVLVIAGSVWFTLGWRKLPRTPNFADLGALLVLALLANLCYCAAYIPDILLQSLVTPSACDRWRRGLWIAGTLVAMLAESYWINDEILSGP